MNFLINGQAISIEDLSPTMNEAFLNLHAAYLTGSCVYDWADFEQASFNFFDNIRGNSTEQDNFFNNFTVIWRSLLNSGRLNKAENLWLRAVNLAHVWEKNNPGDFIHKGTPYYFWGMTSLLRGDVDKGYALMHQALDEDIRTSGRQFPNTPAMALATLNHSKVDQAFRDWLIRQVRFLNKLLETYNTSYGQSLSVEEFQAKFLRNPPNIDTVFLFSYTVARLLQLNKIPTHALQNQFSGQLEISLLFEVVLVIDQAIKAKNPSQWKFWDHFIFVNNNAGLGVGEPKLNQISREFKRDFDTSLTRVLDGTFTFDNGDTLSSQAGDLAIAYRLRNYAAHNVSTINTVWQRFSEVQQSLFNTLFFIVELLY
jgi:hypothetical protein